MTLEGEELADTVLPNAPPVKRQKIEPAARVKGIAPIKEEYLLSSGPDSSRTIGDVNDDDAEGEGLSERSSESGPKKNKRRGQNKNRRFVQPKDTVKLCEQIKLGASECPFGEKCKFVHDVSIYLDSKPKDLDGVCPVFAAIGYCPSGVKCRWLYSHCKDGQMIENEEVKTSNKSYEINRVPVKIQNELQRKKFAFPKSDLYVPYIDKLINKEDSKEDKEAQLDNIANYVEPPFLPSEKKKLNLYRAKIVSPLTTVGNLPYRRLMKTLGADVTYSEMALTLPLIQGSKSEWALPRAHSSEIGGFGVQITASKHWQAIRATEAITKLTTNVSEINLNCGCPIDFVYRSGAGSALLDNPARLMRILRGMNAVSDSIPITAKIRTGTRDGHPSATRIVSRLIEEGQVAAITLHGRSRAQRYTKLADWDYIGQVAKTVKDLRDQQRDGEGKDEGRGVAAPWFIGNGDIFCWKDWYDAIENSGVDSVMVARAALIKPWIFEEIESKQYIDKSASERLDLLRQYANYGLEHWGSDEYGINITRRYLCEFMSFTHRYIPVGILEYLPPKINDRPPPWKGRNDTETLLASGDYKDWIKISEMFLGPVHEDFDFTPKHKSNSYEETRV